MMMRIAMLAACVVVFGAVLVYADLAFGFEAVRPDHWRWLWLSVKRTGGMPPGFASLLFVAGGALILSVLGVVSIAGGPGTTTVFGKHGQSTLHGSARWASYRDIKAAGLLGRDGVVVGGWKYGPRVRVLRHNGPEHVLAFAPTRSGKGVGLVIPTLLSWPESTLVLDIKGENFALTSGWRAREGQRILKFDPTGTGGTRFNPLAEIRIGTDHEIADAQNIAAMIIDPEGKGLRDFWMKSGFAWLTAGILHVLYRTRKEEKRTATLTDVGRHMAAPGDGVEAMLEDMRDFEHGRQAVDDLVRQTAQEMIDRADAERSGVHSSALTELALYRDPIVAANIAACDFRLVDLMNGDQPVSLYLVVPPSDIDRLRPLMRVILNLFLRRLTAEMEFEGGATKASYKHRLLLMLDEFTSIGKLEIFERALAFMAGYGLKCFIIVQDLTQLQAAYGREESIMSNCHIRIAYAPNKMETAKVLSDMSGKTTIVEKRRSRSRRGTEFAGSTSENLSATGRPLMTPDECMRLPGAEKDRQGRVKKAGDMLIFPAGFAPIYGRQVLFFQNKKLLRRSQMAPATGVRAEQAITNKEPGATTKEPVAFKTYKEILNATEKGESECLD